MKTNFWFIGILCVFTACRIDQLSLRSISAPPPSYNKFRSLPQGLPGYAKICGHRLKAIHYDDGNLYVGCKGGGLSISQDHGISFKTVTTAEGLPHNYINDIAIDGDNIYVATPNGVGFSDDGGLSFTALSINPNDPDANHVNTIEGQGQTIFAGTNKGLAIYNGTTWFLDDGTGWSGESSIKIIRDIFVRQNEIICATNHGIAYSADAGVNFNVTLEDELNGFLSDDTYGLAVADDTVYIATAKSVSKANILPESLSIGNFYLDFSDQANAGITTGKVTNVYNFEGTLFASRSTNGLYYSPDLGITWIRRDETHGLASKTIRSVTFNNGDLFVATELGLSIAVQSQGSFDNFQTIDWGHNLDSNVLSIIDSYAQSLYFVSSSGLSFSRDLGESFENVDDNLLIFDLNTQGSTFFLSAFQGLYFSLDEGLTWQERTTLGEWANHTFRVNDALYVATNASGVRISNNGGVTFDSEINVSNNGIFANYCKKVFVFGQNIFIVHKKGSTDPLGVSISTNAGASFEILDENNMRGLNDLNINDIVQYNNKLYFATDSGISTSLDQAMSFQNDQSGSEIRKFIVRDSIIAAATDQGLAFSADAGVTFINLTNQHGLASNDVMGMNFLEPYLFVATRSGVNRIELKTLWLIWQLGGVVPSMQELESAFYPEEELF